MKVMLFIGGGFIVLLAIVSAYIIVEAYYYQCRLGPGLERDLGFREGDVYLDVGRQLHSAVVITSVSDGGVFARAGFRVGDVLPDVSHSSLFKLLHRHRGRVAELAVVDGGDGPPFYERPRRVLRFTVPLHGKQV